MGIFRICNGLCIYIYILYIYIYIRVTDLKTSHETYGGLRLMKFQDGVQQTSHGGEFDDVLDELRHATRWANMGTWVDGNTGIYPPVN